MLKHDIKPFLEDLKARKITNREVAKRLHVSEEHVSRILKLLEVKKDPVQKSGRKALLQARKELRTALANSLPVKEAATQAHCSERTIYRYRKWL